MFEYTVLANCMGKYDLLEIVGDPFTVGWIARGLVGKGGMMLEANAYRKNCGKFNYDVPDTVSTPFGMVALSDTMTVINGLGGSYLFGNRGYYMTWHMSEMADRKGGTVRLSIQTRPNHASHLVSMLTTDEGWMS